MQIKDDSLKGKKLDDMRKLGETNIEAVEENEILTRKYMLKVETQLPDVSEKTSIVTLHIPNVDERIQAGRIMAKLLDGLPLESFESDVVVMARAIGFLSMAIDDGPSWIVNNFNKLDFVLVLSLYNKALEYENRFFRPNSPNKSGNDAGQQNDAGDGGFSYKVDIVSKNFV